MSPERWVPARYFRKKGVQELIKYECSNFGRVRHRKIRKILKQFPLALGTLNVCLQAELQVTVKVNNLILTSFKGPPCDPQLRAVNINGDSNDNRLYNLRWETPKKPFPVTCTDPDTGETMLFPSFDKVGGYEPEAVAEAVNTGQLLGGMKWTVTPIDSRKGETWGGDNISSEGRERKLHLITGVYYEVPRKKARRGGMGRKGRPMDVFLVKDRETGVEVELLGQNGVCEYTEIGRSTLCNLLKSNKRVYSNWEIEKKVKN